jgi:hypothetical protein
MVTPVEGKSCNSLVNSMMNHSPASKNNPPTPSFLPSYCSVFARQVWNLVRKEVKEGITDTE